MDYLFRVWNVCFILVIVLLDCTSDAIKDVSWKNEISNLIKNESFSLIHSLEIYIV